MVIKTLNKNNKLSENLKVILDSHTNDQNELEIATNILKKNGSIKFSIKMSKNIMEKAWKNAQKKLPEGQAKKDLEELTSYLIDRKL